MPFFKLFFPSNPAASKTELEVNIIGFLSFLKNDKIFLYYSVKFFYNPCAIIENLQTFIA